MKKKILTLREKETYKYFDTIKQVEKEKKIKKEYPRRTKKNPRNQTL